MMAAGPIHPLAGGAQATGYLQEHLAADRARKIERDRKRVRNLTHRSDSYERSVENTDPTPDIGDAPQTHPSTQGSQKHRDDDSSSVDLTA